MPAFGEVLVLEELLLASIVVVSSRFTHKPAPVRG
jgi:hypothetical protein